MRLNHADAVLGFDGDPVYDSMPTDEQPDPPKLTFRGLAMMALTGVDAKAGAEEKAQAYAIQVKFFKGKFVKLTVDEAAFIKRAGEKALAPFGLGRLSEWLEGKPQTLATDEDDDLDDGE